MKKIRMEIRKKFKLNNKENAIYYYMLGVTKEIPGNLWHFIQFQMNYLYFKFKKVERKEQIKHKRVDKIKW